MVEELEEAISLSSLATTPKHSRRLHIPVVRIHDAQVRDYFVSMGAKHELLVRDYFVSMEAKHEVLVRDYFVSVEAKHEVSAEEGQSKVLRN